MLKGVYQDDKAVIIIKIIIVITAADKKECKNVENIDCCEMAGNKFYNFIIIDCGSANQHKNK